MRLTAILVLLLPALALGQAAGVVEPQRVDDRYATDKYINLAECDPGQDVQVEFRWSVVLETGVTFRSGVFRFFATNKQPAVSGTGTLAYCPIQDDAPNSVFGGQVGTDEPTSAGGTTGNGLVTMSQIVEVSNRDCTVGADLPIYICVHYHPYTTGTAVDPTPRGLASGTLTLSTQAPGVPRLDGVNPGNERLEAVWTAASTGVSAEWFDIVATPVDSTTATAQTDEAQGSRGWVDSLINGTTYSVTVSALSAAGNPSAASNAIQGTPIPADDFWDRYEVAGGQEEGGCGAGAAGPLALLGLAAAFARRRAGRRP